MSGQDPGRKHDARDRLKTLGARPIAVRNHHASAPVQAHPRRAASVVGVNDANFETPDDVGDARNPHLIPWIVVAAVSVIAIIAALIIVSLLRGSAETTAESNSTNQPATTSSPSSQPEPTAAEEDPASDRAPSVDVGSTSVMQIGQWNATAEVSNRFGALNYRITGEVLLFASALTDSFPASCGEEMRTGWGVERVDGASYRVVKPAGQCAESPELYEQVWGLTQAMADSIKPA